MRAEVNGGAVRLRRIDGHFKRGGVLSSFDCVILHGRQLKVVKPGNYKGSAVLGVVTNMLGPSTKRVRVNRAVGVKCFTRRRRRVSSSRHIVSCIGSVTRCIAAGSKRVDTDRLLREFLFAPSVRCTPVNGLSKKRGEELCLLNILTRGTGILLFSRTKGGLSVPALAVLRSCLGSFAKVIVAMSRSECFLSGMISHVFRLSKGNKVQRFRKKCASCMRTGGHEFKRRDGSVEKGSRLGPTRGSARRRARRGGAKGG